MNEILRNFQDQLLKHDIVISKAQMDQFELYYHQLVEANQHVNLTAITEYHEVYIKHFYDSLSLSFFHDINKTNRMLDVGAGAGFPSIPLKIAFPHLHVTIIDSLNKRVQFLNQLSQKLCLSNIQLIHGRAEDLARDNTHRQQYELVSSRAVAKLNILIEVCVPYLIKGGTFVAMKGSSYQKEIEEASFAIEQLNCRHLRTAALTLPDSEQSQRNLLFFQKVGPTLGKYPRRKGVPFKSPLTR